MTIQTRSDEMPKTPHAGVGARTNPDEVRHDWTKEELKALWDLPFNDLMFEAQLVHRRWFKAHEVQMSTLLSIKTGGCPEDCGYCAQSSKFDTGLKASKLMEVEKVLAEARRAKDAGATRYCMGAAWREPKDRDMDMVCAMVEGIKDMGAACGRPRADVRRAAGFVLHGRCEFDFCRREIAHRQKPRSRQGSDPAQEARHHFHARA